MPTALATDTVAAAATMAAMAYAITAAIAIAMTTAKPGVVAAAKHNFRHDVCTVVRSANL